MNIYLLNNEQLERDLERENQDLQQELEDLYDYLHSEHFENDIMHQLKNSLILRH